MKVVALVVALVMVGVGILAFLEPEGFLAVAGSMTTPFGLLVAATVRVVVGLVLMLAAPRSRAPRALRLLGLVIALAGAATPLLGVTRSRAMVDWLAAQGPAFMRSVAAMAVALGTFVLFAVAPRRAA